MVGVRKLGYNDLNNNFSSNFICPDHLPRAGDWAKCFVCTVLHILTCARRIHFTLLRTILQREIIPGFFDE